MVLVYFITRYYVLLHAITIIHITNIFYYISLHISVQFKYFRVMQGHYQSWVFWLRLAQNIYKSKPRLFVLQ
jgi:hypothetical protein